MLIMLKARYFPLIREGRKTSTIRPWPTCRARVGGSVTFMAGRETLRATCTQIDHVALRDVTETDAVMDGFDSLAAFRTAFAAHYPAASDETRVWVIRFGMDSAHNALATEASGHAAPA